ncbi:MAG: outer membrane protein transport protein [Verrucomicrobiota bacterium]
MNNWTYTACKLALGAGLLQPGLSFALGIRIADQDARATARGNAFAATADNPSAIYYNPAGISQLTNQQVRVGVYGIVLGSEYTSPTGRKSETVGHVQALPQLYYVYHQENSPLAFGLGVYSPYGLSLEWPQNTGFRTLATEGRIGYFTAHPVVSWQVLPTLSLAAGPTFNYADTDLRRGILGGNDQFRFTGHDWDPGFTLGAMWRPHEKHSFGLTYRSRTTQNFQGNAITHLPPIRSATETANAEFNFPQNVVLGYSFRPTPDWNVEFDVDWTDWNSLNTVTLHKPSGDMKLPFNWRSSFFYEFGVTRQLGSGLALSAGYIYSENSVPDRDFSPLVPDSDRHIFSLGLGQKNTSWNWDIAYQYAFSPTRRVDQSVSTSLVGESANGLYHYASHAITISIGYTF